MITTQMSQQVFYEHQDIIDNYTSKLETEINFNRSFINSLIKRNGELTNDINNLNVKVSEINEYIKFERWKKNLSLFKRIFYNESKLLNIYKNGK